jgi:hypothetical protein
MRDPSINITLNELYNRIEALERQTRDLTINYEGTELNPYTILGVAKPKSTIRPVDAKTGKGLTHGGRILWNDSEETIPPIDEEPPEPKEGYNKHSHSRFSGGALIKDVLEIVEYDIDWNIHNPHSQEFLTETPSIKTEENSNRETVDKIGKLDLVFNADTQTWGVAAYEIDVKKCYLVERDIDGNISLDSKGNQKKSPLYNEDQTKTSIIWDENASCFRFFAVYAPGE